MVASYNNKPIARDTLFLTCQEALAAIRKDFEQYELQRSLFRALSPDILGRPRFVSVDPRQGGIWARPEEGGRPKLIPDHRLAAFLGRHLVKRFCAGGPDELQVLARICTRVFQARALAGRDPATGRGGIIIETGMEAFVCRTCGECCRRLDYHHECRAEDYALWQARNRHDIMRWVELTHRTGRISAYRIWVRPGSAEVAAVCPWLVRQPGTECFVCSIHDVKPEICRQYPGSGKHAAMTGCRGFG